MRTIHRRMSYAGLTFHFVCKEITSLHTVRLVETFVVRISVFSCEMNHIPGGFRYRRLIPKLEAQQRALWKVRGADTTLFLAEHPPTPPHPKAKTHTPSPIRSLHIQPWVWKDAGPLTPPLPPPVLSDPLQGPIRAEPTGTCDTHTVNRSRSRGVPGPDPHQIWTWSLTCARGMETISCHGGVGWGGAL